MGSAGSDQAPDASRAAVAVSVIMPVHNGMPYLSKAIESIVNQTFRDFEFLIIDDASTDETPDVLADWVARDPRIIVARQEKNRFVDTINRLLLDSRAPLIARMDADDVSVPDRLERQVAFLKERPDIGMLGGQAVVIDHEGRRVGELRHPTRPELLQTLMLNDFCLVNPTVMMRRAVVEQAGLVREAFTYAEDYEFALRAMTVTGIANLGDVLLHYRRHDRQVSAVRAIEQQRATLVARACARLRLAGLADPMDGRSTLPNPLLPLLPERMSEPFVVGLRVAFALADRLQRGDVAGVLRAFIRLRGHGRHLASEVRTCQRLVQLTAQRWRMQGQPMKAAVLLAGMASVFPTQTADVLLRRMQSRASAALRGSRRTRAAAMAVSPLPPSSPPPQRPDDVVVVQLMGGLGNQMFQYAAGLALATHRRCSLLVDTHLMAQDPLRGFALEAFGLRADDDAAALDRLVPGRRQGKWRRRVHTLTGRAGLTEDRRFFERHFHVDPGFWQQPLPTVLHGYWQSPLYHGPISDRLPDLFTPILEMSDEGKADLEMIRALPCPVAVHIRRGDYQTANNHSIFGSVDERYYHQAMAVMEALHPQSNFVLFSDDPIYTRRVYGAVPGARFAGGPSRPDWEDMTLMRACRHHIIANSSYSWWAAYLARHDDQSVIAPRRWFTRARLASTNITDLYPEHWLTIGGGAL